KDVTLKPQERLEKRQNPLGKKKREGLHNGLTYRPRKNRHNHQNDSDQENDYSLYQRIGKKHKFQKRHRQ
uniref:Uncharacterized protein n=2 Tax=Latimeria chalumnae TaxID=7897 RepID=H3B280_LATCH